MNSIFRSLPALAAGLLALSLSVLADPPVAPGILEPKSAAEAWNVIRLSTANVDRLLEEKRLGEVAMQISYCSPSLRLLVQVVPEPSERPAVDAEVQRAFISVNAIAVAAQQGNPVGAANALAALRRGLETVARHFSPAVVSADIFVCPMHPDFLAESAKTPCAKCGMPLLTRRIAYSAIYTKPGEPTLRLTAKASGPIKAGEKIEVTVRLEHADKSPVLHSDLLVMHTQPIHLLIEEPGLGDYHHEHPVPTSVPGEYRFAFTPGKTTPYRIWADVVPASTGVQELPHVDLPSAGEPGAIEDKADRLTTTAGGYHFTLTFAGSSPLPVQVGQTRNMSVKVTNADGSPVTALEPVMNAFSHLVGFYDDYQTIVHLHPAGVEVVDQSFRGGPNLDFVFYPPRAGFIRLYCQVSIGGQMLFAPFNLNVQP